MLDPRRVQATREPWPSATLGRPAAWPVIFTSSSASISVLPHLFKLPPAAAFGSDECCREDRRALRLSTGCAKAPQASSLRPPPPASLRSCLPERLSFLHDVLSPSPSQRDPGCSGRCLPEVSLASHRLLWRCVSEDLYLLTGLWRAPAPGTLLPIGSFRSGRDLLR